MMTCFKCIAPSTGPEHVRDICRIVVLVLVVYTSTTTVNANKRSMRALHPTIFWTRLQNNLPTPSTPTAAVLTAATAASNLLAHLLPSHVPILTTPQHTLPPNLPNPIHTLPSSNDLTPAARWAIQNSINHLVLPTTRLDHALTTLTSNTTDSHIGGPGNGLELLPPGYLHLHQPLITLHEDILDATAAALLPPPYPSFQRLAEHALGDIPVSAILRHSTHKKQALDALEYDSTNLLQDSILEASHWGFVVLRRSTLAQVFHDKRAQPCAVHALSRVVQHVSGSSIRLPLEDPQITRMAADLLKLQGAKLAPLPKGRTAAGVVARPATGRFARRLSRDAPHDLMIISREPDHENAALNAMRLRGNYACAPLDPDGVYWDNRFVLLAGHVSDLSEQNPPLRMRDVLLAALKSQDNIEQDLADTRLYVRQMRHVDWERITAATARVRDFQVPFQCILALPAMFQKKQGANEHGELIASPHLGISARSDMYFTAVCMPRFRSLPEASCPGFVEEFIGDLQSHKLT